MTKWLDILREASDGVPEGPGYLSRIAAALEKSHTAPEELLKKNEPSLRAATEELVFLCDRLVSYGSVSFPFVEVVRDALKRSEGLVSGMCDFLLSDLFIDEEGRPAIVERARSFARAVLKEVG